MGDDERIRPGIRGGGDERPQRLRAPIVFVRAHDQPTLGDVESGLRVLAADQPRALHGALKATRVRLADRNLGGLEGLTDRLGIGATGVVELALLGDVVEVQRIGIGLIGVCGAVSEHDDVAAAVEQLQDGTDGRGRLSPDGPSEGDQNCQGTQGREHARLSRATRSLWLEPRAAP